MSADRMTSAEQIATDLDLALSRFEFKRAEDLCGRLVHAVHASEEPIPPAVERSLSALRRKRRLACVTTLAEALIATGRASPAAWRAYVQALIERGLLLAAEHGLREAAARTRPDTPEAFELQGLAGRLQKQWYVTAPSASAARRRDTLQRAIDIYAGAYLADPARNYWHGINAVALLERGRRDGLEVSAGRPAADIAASILSALESAEQARPDAVGPWEAATMMEAALALGRTETVLQRARQYAAHPAADAFEVASTLRQLVEIWNLDESEPPGSLIIPMLGLARARLLHDAGEPLTFDAASLADERARVARLEVVHGFDRFQTLQWYRRGLDCCSAVARLETETGRGFGTGWLLAGGDWPHRTDSALLVTNAHVVSPADHPFPGALLPGEAIANFQVAGTRSRLGDVVWSSPVGELDCTILRLTTPPAVQPLQLSSRPVTWATPPPRLYIIGHPGGRDVEFSLQDNHLLACDDRLLHYRTPTEGGSSGSPVFDDAWRVVALHHAGDSRLARLDGQTGTYEANEGIAIAALLQAAAASVALR
jgi:hypothetical protein